MMRLEPCGLFVQMGSSPQNCRDWSGAAVCGDMNSRGGWLGAGGARVAPEIHHVLVLEWACMPVRWEKDLVQCESSL